MKTFITKRQLLRDQPFRSCLTCDTRFQVKASIARKGLGKYCSAICYFPTMKGRKHPNPPKMGELNHRWTGDAVGNRGLHQWVGRRLGKPRYCERCQSTDAKAYEWANVSREYKRDIWDWWRLCNRCHQDYDGHSIQKIKERMNEEL